IGQLDHAAVLELQSQPFAVAGNLVGVLLEAPRLLRPLLGRIELELAAGWPGAGIARLGLRARRAGQCAKQCDRRQEASERHFSFSMVSKEIDRNVASAISSISSSTRCRAAPMSVSSPGSLARRPGAGSNRATM